jgi:hypothetical protein
LSKTVTATLPAVLLVVAWWPLGRLERRNLTEAAPFFAIGGATAAITVWLEKYHVLARGPAWDFSWPQRLLIAGKSWWFSLGTLIWPAHLAFVYPRWEAAMARPAQFLYPAGAIAVVTVLWLFRGWLGRGAAAALLSYSAVLAPALGFVDFYPMRFSFVADHYQYLACIGPLCLAAELLRSAGSFLAARLKRPEVRSVAAGAAAAAVLGILVVLANRHAADFKDEVTLWKATIEHNPQAKIAHNNLGIILARDGRAEEAREVYGQAVVRRVFWFLRGPGLRGIFSNVHHVGRPQV